MPAGVVAALLRLLLVNAESMLAVDDCLAALLPADEVEATVVVFNDTDCVLAVWILVMSDVLSGTSVLLLATLDFAEGVSTNDSVVFPAEDSALSVDSGDSVVLSAALDKADIKEEGVNDDSCLLVALDAGVPVNPSELSNAVLGGLLAKNDVMAEDILLESDVVGAGDVFSMLE